MKKIAIITVLVFALAIVLSSCKSSEHCPAYSNVDNNNIEKAV